MSTILEENKKRIRKPMNVYCTMIAKYTKADIKVPSKTGNIAIVDTNIDTAIDNDKWNMRKLADFQAEDGIRE